MPLSSLLTSLSSTSVLIDALTELQRKFGEARNSLVRIRADRVRLARTGWRPRVPSETKLIRSAEWVSQAGKNENNEHENALDFDLKARFVPIEAAYRGFIRELERAKNEDRKARVFLRGIELDEPRFSIGGRGICASFFDLALTLSLNPRAVIVLPKVDGYLEARFWAEVARSLETSLGLLRDSIRFEVALDTLGGVVEAEEILFELKDSVVGIVYDVRLDRFDALLLESGAPSVPREDPTVDPWSGVEVAARVKNLESLARQRGVRIDLRPKSETNRSADGSPASPLLTLDSLHGKTRSAFQFLRGWFGGEPFSGGKDWTDFEVARALLWTAIHSGFLREENYEAWREEFGGLPFEVGSVEDAAIRTLDPLVRTAVFPDSAKPLAFSILLEREKVRGVNALRLA
jgi:hypothetical protein